MVYGFGDALKNLNNYCQEKSLRLRTSLSPSRSSTQSSSTMSQSESGSTNAATSPPSLAQEITDLLERRKEGMSRDEFRKYGKETVDYIVDYLETIHKRRVVPAIEPGYLKDLIPQEAPRRPESFEACMDDFEKLIMPGITHWQHPRFHAYFPAGNSFPSIIADMLSDAIGSVGFSWAACPAMTELELVVLDWLGKMIGLPKEFLPYNEDGKGGGVIQSSASECNFVTLLAARFEVMKELRQRFPFVEDGLLLSKLIAYCSKEAHSSVEKACMIGMVKLRILETDSKFRLRGETLRNAIQEDRNLGLIPFFVSTTLGTTSCCSFDVLSEIGPICKNNDLWLHVDAAYAGSAMICPEFRPLLNGIEYAMSFNTNPNKWMLLNFDCSTMWVRDRFKLTQALVVDPLYLQHSWAGESIDYRHWGIPLSRRFRSLKLWFVIRMYGVEGLQKYIREHVRLAKRFEMLLKNDSRFEVINEVIMGLVCFRLKGDDKINKNLLTILNASGRIHMVPASLGDRYVIRFCVCAENATDKDIDTAFEIIVQTAEHVLHDNAKSSIAEEDEEAAALEEMTQELSITDNVTNPIEQQEPEPLKSLKSQDSLPEKTQKLERQLSKDELIAQKQQETLAKKRSFLVRMVSDPKCYNPKIVRHLNMTNHRKMSQDLYRDRTMMQAISHGQRPNRLSSQSPIGTSLNWENEDDDQRIVADVQTGVQTPL